MSNIITNRKLVDDDTHELIDKYIDDICAEPEFLCQNRELCGTSTSIYTSIENVNNVCKNIKQANVCENDIKECIVLAKNQFDGSEKLITTSFVNIIIPIPNTLDSHGNNYFLRLPPLSGSMKKNSSEICHICACMDRFAKSPGGNDKSNTSPGQDECIYPDKFEYFYYPLYIENINRKLKTAPVIKLGKYKIINDNIIYANSQEDLVISNLYTILRNNGVTEANTLHFLLNVLYRNDQERAKELKLFLEFKKEKASLYTERTRAYHDSTSFYVILIAFVAFIIFILLNKR